MTTRYDNFSDQVQKFGVRFVCLVFADENFADFKGNEEIRLYSVLDTFNSMMCLN